VKEEGLEGDLSVRSLGAPLGFQRFVSRSRTERGEEALSRKA